MLNPLKGQFLSTCLVYDEIAVKHYGINLVATFWRNCDFCNAIYPNYSFPKSLFHMYIHVLIFYFIKKIVLISNCTIATVYHSETYSICLNYKLLASDSLFFYFIFLVLYYIWNKFFVFVFVLFCFVFCMKISCMILKEKKSGGFILKPICRSHYRKLSLYSH